MSTAYEAWLESKKESVPLPIDQAHEDDLGVPGPALAFLHWLARTSRSCPLDELHYVAFELGLSDYDTQRFLEAAASWV